MHELYELKELLCKKLEEYGRKGDITANTLEVVDKLARATKNIGKIIEMNEETEEGYSSDAGPYRGGSYTGGGSYARGGRRGGGRRGGANQYGSYAMGGYSRANEDTISQLHELSEMMPDEHLRMKVQRIVSNMEGR